MEAFADHFSALAVAYGQFRPDYPAALFDHLASLAPSCECAWDCATGNGQAAVPLAARFERVVASDASAAQLAEARVPANVQLCVARAERVPLADDSVDLVTVAQALHWFRLPAFFTETQRVLRAGGVLAVWTYHLFSITRAIDECVRYFNRDVVGPYWPPERHLVAEAYATIDFPYAEVATTTMPMAVTWSLEHLLAYVGTWSAVAAYRRQHGTDPLEEFAREMRVLWGEPDQREVRFPLTLKTMRKPAKDGAAH